MAESHIQPCPSSHVLVWAYTILVMRRMIYSTQIIHFYWYSIIYSFEYYAGTTLVTSGEKIGAGHGTTYTEEYWTAKYTTLY